MKDIPPLAGWPTQISIVHEPKASRKKRRTKKHSKK
jgi:hypothetical protein